MIGSGQRFLKLGVQLIVFGLVQIAVDQIVHEQVVQLLQLRPDPGGISCRIPAATAAVFHIIVRDVCGEGRTDKSQDAIFKDFFHPRLVIRAAVVHVPRCASVPRLPGNGSILPATACRISCDRATADVTGQKTAEDELRPASALAHVFLDQRLDVVEAIRIYQRIAEVRIVAVHSLVQGILQHPDETAVRIDAAVPFL